MAIKQKYNPTKHSIWQHPDHSEALEDHLRYLIAQGLSSELIGQRFGVSRSSIIGKAHRLGIAHWTPKIRLNLASSAHRHVGAKPRCISPPPPPPQPMLPPKLISDAKLTNRTCRFPMWCDDASSPGQFLYCGVNQADLAKGKPYCATHAAICFSPPDHIDKVRRPW